MLKFQEKEFLNYGKCLEISNGIVELLVTLDLGPRIIKYAFVGGENVMHTDVDRKGNRMDDEMDEMFGKGSAWYLYGGHRLWISPEYTETYYPDNDPVAYTTDEKGATFTPPLQRVTGLQFKTRVEVAQDSADVKIIHTIENCSGEPVVFAPWALSVLAPGGVEMIEQNDEDTGYLANRTMVIWHYVDLTDDRLYLGKRFITLKQDAAKGPFKLGFDLHKAKAAYLNHGDLFVKRYTHYEDGEYPDNGCSFETYTNESFLECETLGEIGVKPAGSIVRHEETWTLYPNVELKDRRDEAEIAALFEKYKI